MKLLGSPGRLPLSICDEGGDGLIACESCSPGYDCITVIGPASINPMIRPSKPNDQPVRN